MNERDAYINELEKSNDVLHKFKHDYKNLLLSLSASVNDSDNDNLKSSISKLLNYKRVDLRSDNNTTNLYKIKDKLVKGILVSKLMFAKNNNIKTDFEIDDNVTIPENYSIDITRMLGILLDNAIDASLESDQPELIFAVVSFDDYIEFIIKNSIIPNSNIHTNDVYKTGFTTKENHGGLGLASVREIVDSNDDLFIQNKIKNGYYSTILTVLEDEQCY
ncbi:sensor histidine kinase [Companilactobacillus muriivasis]|uniref:sensor histidine kinase n=1 Tax=Companilactobacillus muriivasis TaxID=3081444 RepID=UPI0030C71BC4